MENSLKSGMTQAKILVCENCNTTVTDTGIGTTDTGTRVITIIEATDEADSNLLMSSNSIFGGFGGGSSDKRSKRGLEAAALAGNETTPTAAMATTSTAVTEDEEASLTAEMLRVNPSDAPKPVPIKRDTVDGVQSDMTQAIMEQRVDYDVDDEFVAANGHGYDAPRTRPVKNNYRGYSQRIVPMADGEEEDRLEDAEDDDGDHNSHYEYVPMEFDADGNHR